MIKRNLLTGAFMVAAAVALMMAPTTSSAFEATYAGPPVPPALAGKGEGPWAKAGSELRRVVAAFRVHEAAGGGAPFDPGNASVQYAGGQIVIDAIAAGDAVTLLRDLQGLGLENGAQIGGMVSGRLPLGAVGRAVELGSLRAVSASLKPETNNFDPDVYGIVHDRNGAMAMYADGTGYTGAGVRVGVSSDTYDNNGNPDYDGDGFGEPPATNAADDITSKDLPADVIILDDSAAPGIDEGRAMMQLIHDVAPGASLSFHTAFTGMANFAQGIIDLAAGVDGADVVVDDIIYYAESMFQDGIVAQAVDQVYGDGVAYFSSAGNGARHSYEAPGGFVASGERFYVRRGRGNGPLDDRGMLHDFDPDDDDDTTTSTDVDWAQEVTLPVGYTLTISLQWDQPFASNCSGCPGSQSDIDIYIVDENNVIRAQSITNNIDGDAVEVVQLYNGGGYGTALRILITHFDQSGGVAPVVLKYVWFGSSAIVFNEYTTNSPTVYGHANAAGAEAVGAAFYQDTPAGDPNGVLTVPILEYFSSAGGVLILFAYNGDRIIDPVPTIPRLKPEIVAPDGTNTTFFYRDITADADDFPNFFGTSAAAPHAAAVAAQMLEANSGLSPLEIYSALEDTALDIVERRPVVSGGPLVTIADGGGVDDDSGHGLIDATAAVAAVALQDPNNAAQIVVNNVLAVAEAGTAIITTSILQATDADNPPLSTLIYTVTNGPAHGTLSPGATFSQADIDAGSVSYQHDGSETIADSFIVSVSDGISGSDAETFDITVTSVDDPPVADDQSVDTAPETFVDITLTATDPDAGPQVFSISVPPSGGSLVESFPVVRYTPSLGTTNDTFKFKVNGTSEGTVTISVVATPSDPAAPHIGDIDSVSINNGGTWTAMITVFVEAGGEPVVGASVNGSWSEDTGTGAGNCSSLDGDVTDANGQCTVEITGIRKRDGSGIYTVVNYDNVGNHDPDGDSNGTSITVLKP